MDLHSSIHPAALDLMLGSATNAVQKGQSQYSTPVELAAAIAKELPSFRPIIVDLTCGPGQLLAGCANKTTEYLLGCDLDPRRPKGPPGSKSLTVQADLTALYGLMRQIDFRADCFALNPPWSLHWHAARLGGLADSEVPAVAKTFKALSRVDAGEGRRGARSEGGIDSTLGTLMIALDRLSDVGEGFLIGYTSTLERLLFAPGAVGALLVQHVWKKVALPSLSDVPDKLPEPLQAATVIYFSAAHDAGPTADGRSPRFMSRIHSYNFRLETVNQWKALQEVQNEEGGVKSGSPPKFHLSLRDGQIVVRLGLFDTELTKVNRELARTAERLHELDGRNPMQVVMQRDERNFILGLLRDCDVSKAGLSRRSLGEGGWTVDPLLREAVKEAVSQYNASRAPLVPLPKIQRLGYLDESDDILCVQDLAGPDSVGPVFQAGRRYPLATKSMRFTRLQKKPNLQGEDEELELSGQELAILIQPDSGEDAREYCFMDGALRAPTVSIGENPGADVVDFTLQELVDHFEIPEVPDIATVDPARYNAFIEQLHRLEQLTIC